MTDEWYKHEPNLDNLNSDELKQFEIRQKRYELNLKTFEVHRAYITHEDGLVNQRTTWTLAIQSFASAVTGLALQKRHDLYEKLANVPPLGDPDKILPVLYLYEKILGTVFFLGAATAIIGGISIQAAAKAVDNVAEEWKKHHKGYTNFSQTLPDLTGGGLPKEKGRGKLLAQYMPWCFLCVWGAMTLHVFLDPKTALVLPKPTRSAISPATTNQSPINLNILKE